VKRAHDESPLHHQAGAQHFESPVDAVRAVMETTWDGWSSTAVLFCSGSQENLGHCRIQLKLRLLSVELLPRIIVLRWVALGGLPCHRTVRAGALRARIHPGRHMRSIAHRADDPATDVPRTHRIAVAISAYSLGGGNRRDADSYRCGETRCREIESHGYFLLRFPL